MTCEMCDAPYHSLGGIQTTLGYVCYECVKWAHQVAVQTRALARRDMQQIINDIDQTP